MGSYGDCPKTLINMAYSFIVTGADKILTQAFARYPFIIQAQNPEAKSYQCQSRLNIKAFRAVSKNLPIPYLKYFMVLLYHAYNIRTGQHKTPCTIRSSSGTWHAIFAVAQVHGISIIYNPTWPLSLKPFLSSL